MCVCVCACVYTYAHTRTTNTQIAYLLTGTCQVYIFVLKVHLKKHGLVLKSLHSQVMKLHVKTPWEIIQQLLIRRYIHFLMFSCKDYLLKQSLESKASISWQRAGEKKDGSDQRDKRVPLSIFLSDFSKIVQLYSLVYIHTCHSQNFSDNF